MIRMVKKNFINNPYGSRMVKKKIQKHPYRSLIHMGVKIQKFSNTHTDHWLKFFFENNHTDQWLKKTFTQQITYRSLIRMIFKRSLKKLTHWSVWVTKTNKKKLSVWQTFYKKLHLTKLQQKTTPANTNCHFSSKMPLFPANIHSKHTKNSTKHQKTKTYTK